MTPPEPATTGDSAAHRIARLAGAALALGLFATAMWFAWLGWDHEYYLVDGVAQGPYRAWQVIGCGVSIAAGAVVAHLWVRDLWAILVLAVAADLGFTVPWAVDAAASDDSGLWAVGLVFAWAGIGIGLVLLLALVSAVVRRSSSA